MSIPEIALPGQLLGPSASYAPGPGTHLHDSQIYASIAGTVSSRPQTTTPSSSKSKTGTKPLPLLSVARPQSIDQAFSTTGTSSLLPEVDSLVLARITRLTSRSASLLILSISNSACRSPFQGLIRREDVRATEKDKVKIEESFRVGDIVRGVVLSLGDQSNYYVSTARNDLGVVLAWGEDGRELVPVSWKEVMDVASGRRETRKVAKPF